MVQQQVAAADHGHGILGACEAAREGRSEGRVAQVVTLEEVEDRREAVQVDGTVDAIEVRLLEGEVLEQELGQVIGAVLRDLQPDGLGELALAQLALESLEQPVERYNGLKAAVAYKAAPLTPEVYKLALDLHKKAKNEVVAVQKEVRIRNQAQLKNRVEDVNIIRDLTNLCVVGEESLGGMDVSIFLTMVT